MRGPGRIASIPALLFTPWFSGASGHAHTWNRIIWLDNCPRSLLLPATDVPVIACQLTQIDLSIYLSAHEGSLVFATASQSSIAKFLACPKASIPPFDRSNRMNMISSSDQPPNMPSVQRRMSQVLCPTCNEPQREQTYQLEPLDGPPTNSFHTDDGCSDSCSNDQPEGEETSASQSSNSASQQQQQHDDIVRELEQQIIDLKMDLAEEKDRNGHLVQSKVDLERELSKSQKSHGALLVESTKHKFEAQNAMRENESLHAENERLRAEIDEMKRQRLHAGMVATVDQDPDSALIATGNTPDLNASDGSLGDILKDLFTSDKRRRSTASTAACTTATSTTTTTTSSSTEAAACPRPSFQRANSGGFFRDLAADIERRRSSLPGRPIASTSDLQSIIDRTSAMTAGRRSSTSDAPTKTASVMNSTASTSSRPRRPSRRAPLLMNQRNYQSDFALCSSTSDDQSNMLPVKDHAPEEQPHEHAPSMLHVVGQTTWGKLKD